MRRILADPASAPPPSDGTAPTDETAPSAPRAARAIDCAPNGDAPPATGGRGSGRSADRAGGGARRVPDRSS